MKLNLILNLVLFVLPGNFVSCKRTNNASLKDISGDVCSESQSRITQAENDLKSRNAPVPTEETGSAANSDPGDPESTDSEEAQFSLNGSNCDAEGASLWNRCMAQKCLDYNKTVYFSFNKLNCDDVNGNFKSGKITDSDSQCARIQGEAVRKCVQQNTATSQIEYVCTMRVGAAGGDSRVYQWMTRAEVSSSGAQSLSGNVRVVQAGSVEAQRLDSEECRRLFTNGSTVGGSGSNGNAANGGSGGGSSPSEQMSANREADIARFTQNLATARSDHKKCLADVEAKRKASAQTDASTELSTLQMNCDTAGGHLKEGSTPPICECIGDSSRTFSASNTGGETCASNSNQTAPANNQQTAPANNQQTGPANNQQTACPSDKPLRLSDGTCSSNYSVCKQGYYMGEDGRCYIYAKCAADQYLAVDGKCYPKGNGSGNAKSCPSGQVLTTLGTCVPDENFSNYTGNYE